MAETKITWTPEDEARARSVAALVADKGEGYRPILRSGDLARLSVSVMLTAEMLVAFVKSQRANPLAGGEDPSQLLHDLLSEINHIGGNLEEAKRQGLENPYRAALESVRLVWRGEHEIAKGSGEPLLAPPLAAGGLAQMGQPIVPLVLGVVGVLAAAVTSYYVADRVCQMKDGSALAAVVLKSQLEELQLRIAKGAPLPDPQKPIEWSALIRHMADANASTPFWLVGAGAAAAALVGVGVYGARKHAPRASTAEVVHANPHRPRRARRRKHVARRGNPLAHGYSRDTVSKNIAGMVKAGRSRAVAAAASLHAARVDYRKRHPTGAFPRHLETPAERREYVKAKPKAKPRRKHHAKAKRKPKAKRR